MDTIAETKGYRVLEVGPWDTPAIGYINHPDLSEYIGVDMGVWEGSKEGGDARKVFYQALERGGFKNNRVKFINQPVSAYSGRDGFDVVFAGNVFGDPVALEKNSDGSLKYPHQEDRILTDALGRMVADSGVIQVLETYTPFKKDLLLDLMGRAGLGLSTLIEGDDLMDFLKWAYPTDWDKMQERISPVNRLEYAKSHRLEEGVDSPYLATFKRV